MAGETCSPTVIDVTGIGSRWCCILGQCGLSRVLCGARIPQVHAGELGMREAFGKEKCHRSTHLRQPLLTPEAQPRVPWWALVPSRAYTRGKILQGKSVLSSSVWSIPFHIHHFSSFFKKISNLALRSVCLRYLLFC